MPPPNLHTLPTEILKPILEEAFAGSEIRISLYHKNDPTFVADSALEYFRAFSRLVDPESPTLGLLFSSKHKPQDSSPARFFVARALNNYFGPLTVCHRLYGESFSLFWQRTTFVLEEEVTSDDLLDWIPDFWKSHIARVQTEGSHVLSRELKGTRGLEGLERLCLHDYGNHGCPPIIHEIYGQSDQQVEEMILLCRADCLRGMAYSRRTLAYLATLAPSVNIVMSFFVAVYHTDDWTGTFAGWLPDIDVEIHTKPPMIYLNGLTLSEYKMAYVRPDDETELCDIHDMNEWRYYRSRRHGTSGMMPFAVLNHIWS